MIHGLALAAILAGLATPAAAAFRVPAPILPSAIEVRAVASYYGPGFHGRPMANGRRFDRWGRSAAHKFLPFGTRLLVRNPATGLSEIVTVEDRGPFKPGRDLDLSQGTARRIGGEAAGVFVVEVVRLP